MISLLFLAALQTLDPESVTFVELAAPLSRLMPRLADVCHQPINVSPTMADEVMCIDVHEAPIGDFLAKVASATGGAWEQHNGDEWLVPDAKARAALTEKGVQKRIPRIEADIKRLGPDPTTEGSDRQANRAMDEASLLGQALVFHMLSGVGARAIAALRPGGRLVYSNNPNPHQFAFPRDFSEDVSACVVADNKALEEINDSNRSIVETQGGSSYTPIPPVTVPIAKADLVVDSGPFGGLDELGVLESRVIFYDAQGKVVDPGISIAREMNLLDGGGRTRDPATDYAPTLQPKPAAASAEPLIPLSEAAIQFFKFADSEENIKDNGAKKKIRGRLLSPDKVDPLSYGAEFLVGSAKSRHWQLVASLPDPCVDWAEFIDSGPDGPTQTSLTPTQFMQLLQADKNVSVEQSGHWLIVSPAQFAYEPTNRVHLALLSSGFDNKVDLGLEDLLALAREGYGVPGRGFLVRRWLGLICPPLVGMEREEDWEVLGFCAALGPDALRSLLSGNAMRFGELAPETRALAENLVYFGSDLLVDKSDPVAGKEQLLRSGRTDAEAGGVIPNDYRAESTEVAPNGIPGNALIIITANFDPLIRPSGRTDFSYSQLLSMTGQTPEELGSQAADLNWTSDENHIESVSYDQEEADFKMVQIGVRSTYKFRIYASADSFRPASIQIPSFSSPEVFKLHSMPKAVQDRFDAAVAKAKADAQEKEKELKKATPP